MLVLQVFIVATVVSFLGSVPPGTLNLIVLQLGLEKRIKAALRFSIAVAIVEYPYAWIAVAFEQWITQSTLVQQNFTLTGAVVMMALGLFGLWSARKPSSTPRSFQHSGFRKGLLLSVLNPQAIPWWIAMTAYLKLQGWVSLDEPLLLHSYLLGTAVGALLLLAIVAVLSHKLSERIQHLPLVRYTPSVVLILLGTISLINFFLS